MPWNAGNPDIRYQQAIRHQHGLLVSLWYQANHVQEHSVIPLGATHIHKSNINIRREVLERATSCGVNYGLVI